jgi:hypothetical protein
VSYSDDLKHPFWQRKRLELFQARGFACERCGDSETELHIHHEYYKRGWKPWDYPLESLHVLCKNCHSYVDDELSICPDCGQSFLTFRELQQHINNGNHLDPMEEPEAVYQYHDVSGVLLFEKLRYPGKRFQIREAFSANDEQKSGE